MRKDPDPQKLHDRSAESAKETRQAILGLASGALAVFFLALTTNKDVEPPLHEIERVTVLISLACMSVAILAALWSAFADAQWSYLWARAIEQRPEDAQLQQPIPNRRDSFHRQKRISERVVIWAFALGVFLAAVYLALRIYALPTKTPDRPTESATGQTTASPSVTHIPHPAATHTPANGG
jgi:hypothetical protein